MEKLLYALWRSPSEAPDAFRDRLLNDTAGELLEAGVRGLQINAADSAVAPAAKSRMESSTPPPDGIVTLWLDAASARSAQESIIVASAPRAAGYLVTESEPLPNTAHVAQERSRTPGYNQVVFIQKPDRMHYSDWMAYWQGVHGPIALEVQSTFRYVQNVIARPLSYQAPTWDAVVEECFPSEAMTDPHAFYDAVGDPEKFRANAQAMLDSCNKFLDFGRLDCIPTSEYIIKTPR